MCLLRVLSDSWSLEKIAYLKVDNLEEATLHTLSICQTPCLEDENLLQMLSRLIYGLETKCLNLKLKTQLEQLVH